MIGWLRGELVTRRPEGELIVDVGGVGYRRHRARPRCWPRWAIRGRQVELHVHTHVREDAIVLYGFATAEERRCFEALLGAHGVGPVLGAGRALRAAPRRPGPGRARRGPRSLCTVPGRRPQDRGPARPRPAVASRAPRLRRGRRSRRPRRARPRRGARCAPPWPSSGTGPTRSAGPSRRARRGRRGGAAPPGAARAGGGAVSGREPRCRLRCHRAGHRCDDDGVAAEPTGLSTTVGAGRSTPSPTRPSSPTRPGCGPAGSRSSSARPQLTEHLEIVLEAARRARATGGPPACSPGRPASGKTSLAGIVAAEMGVGLARSPRVRRLCATGDLAAILTDLQHGDVLFIDEIHRLPRPVEEVLYPAMEDFQLDILIGKGPTARSIRLDLPRFTLVGATTRTGLLTEPAARPVRVRRPPRPLQPPTTCRGSCARSAGILGVEVDHEGARQIAARARGTPRIANRLLRRVRDYRGGPGRGRHHRATGPRGPRAVRGGRARASTRWTAPSSTPCAGGSTAGRSGSSPWRSAWGRRPTRSRTPTSPTCSSRACSSAPHGGGWPPPGLRAPGDVRSPAPSPAGSVAHACGERPPAADGASTGAGARPGVTSGRGRKLGARRRRPATMPHSPLPLLPPSWRPRQRSKSTTSSGSSASRSCLPDRHLRGRCTCSSCGPDPSRPGASATPYGARCRATRCSPVPGIFGTVLDVEADRVTLETAPGTRITVLRSTIARRITDPAVETPSWDEHDEDEAHGAYQDYEHDEHEDADEHDEHDDGTTSTTIRDARGFRSTTSTTSTTTEPSPPMRGRRPTPKPSPTPRPTRKTPGIKRRHEAVARRQPGGHRRPGDHRVRRHPRGGVDAEAGSRPGRRF